MTVITFKLTDAERDLMLWSCAESGFVSVSGLLRHLIRAHAERQGVAAGALRMAFDERERHAPRRSKQAVRASRSRRK